MTYTKFEDHNDPSAGEDVEGRNINDYTWNNNTAHASRSSDTQYQEHGEFTPYAGIVYDLTDEHSVYASYTSIFKPQSVHDRDGKSPEPRTGDAFEVGLKSEFLDGRINTSFDVSMTKQDNLAELDPGQIVSGTLSERAYAT